MTLFEKRVSEVLAIFDEAMNTSRERAGAFENILILDAEYSGELLLGNAHGYGICKDHDLSLYEGQWQDNNKHGVGTMRFTFGEISYFYAGEWKEDQQHGMGLFQWADGAKYCGNFKEDKKQGSGMLVQAEDKRVCMAEWDDDEGQGVIYWPDGSVYEGCIDKDGDRQG